MEKHGDVHSCSYPRRLSTSSVTLLGSLKTAATKLQVDSATPIGFANSLPWFACQSLARPVGRGAYAGCGAADRISSSAVMSTSTFTGLVR